MQVVAILCRTEYSIDRDNFRHEGLEFCGR